MKEHAPFEAVRMAADAIVFVAALVFLFYFAAQISKAIDICMPMVEYMG